METQCPQCERPYGKRKRCYYCHGKQRSGETQKCQQCGKEFYAARWQIADTKRNQGTYCSKQCLFDSQKLEGTGHRYQRKDGYIAVYYPSHPDAPQSGWMLEHRLVAEQKYGRRIEKHEHVHHINAVRDDNRPENLEVIDAGTHGGLSNKRGAELRRAMRNEMEQMRAELDAYHARYGPLPEE
jgi:hypothetical protein